MREHRCVSGNAVQTASARYVEIREVASMSWILGWSFGRARHRDCGELPSCPRWRAASCRLGACAESRGRRQGEAGDEVRYEASAGRHTQGGPRRRLFCPNKFSKAHAPCLVGSRRSKRHAQPRSDSACPEVWVPRSSAGLRRLRSHRCRKEPVMPIRLSDTAPPLLAWSACQT